MKKILFVDDHPDILRLLGLILRKEGRTLLKAFSAEEALTVALREKPDLIILDVMMPGGMDGNELALILREKPATSSCSIIIMTARGREEAKDLALAAGADDFICKPFEMARMREKVETLLEIPVG